MDFLLSKLLPMTSSMKLKNRISEQSLILKLCVIVP